MVNTLQYPVVLKKDGKGWLVKFPDFDDAITGGDTKEEALQMAEGALSEVIAARIAHREMIPNPSPARGRPVVMLPPQVAAKALLWKTMHQKDISKAELARRLRVKAPQVDRLFKVQHNSKLEQLVDAFAALGLKVVIGTAR